ncbi:MAG: LamG domain-containing protein, partial [Chloroflexi bacterium]|nr:LamG domain-containing protein [Chloroflexota bacterium]
AAPSSSLIVSGTAQVNPNAITSQHLFAQEVEAALDTGNIDIAATDPNAANLLVYMPFEDAPGATTFENIIDTLDPSCTTVACPTAGLRGIVDRAAYFDGDSDYLDLNTANRMNLRTIAAWVKADGGAIADFRDNAVYDMYGVQLDFDKFQSFHVSGSTNIVDIDLPENEWAHLVVAIEVFMPGDDIIRVYVNGQLQSTTIVPTIFVNGSDYPQLGADKDKANFLRGYLDDFRVYDVTLSAADVLDLYEQTAPLMRFEFDETRDATTFSDNSLNHYVGIPTTQTYFDTALQQNVTKIIPIPGTDGKIGNTALFDGSGMLDVLDAGSTINLIADFTIMTWVKTTATDVGILAKNDADTAWESGEKLFYLDSDGYPTFVGYGNAYIRSATAVNDDIWHQISVVWDVSSSTGRIFVDGLDVTSSDSYAPNNADNAGDTIKIGSPNYSEVPNFFVGELDELAVYGRPLTTGEMMSLYLRELRWYRARSSHLITVDTDDPTIQLLTDYPYRPNGYIQLAVAATDSTSRVVLLDMGVKAPGDIDFTWQNAPVCADAGLAGLNWCPSFDSAQLTGEGVYETQFRAVDAVGHETMSAVYIFYVDGSAPTTGSSYSGDWLTAVPHPTADLSWTLPLAGSISDPDIAIGISGSGVVTNTVLISLVDSSGAILNGAPQAVTVSGWGWSIDYLLGGERPSGRYTIEVTSADLMGNEATAVIGAIYLDERSPSVDTLNGVLPAVMISDTLVLSGTVGDQPAWGGAVARFHFEEGAGAS